MKRFLLAIPLCGLFLAEAVNAHHSFAVHFVGDEQIEVQGVVQEFRFTNPHGVLLFTATDDDGNESAWRAETNSPNLLRRRGWSSEALKPGDRITIVGFPARSEENYMRISSVAVEGGSTFSAQARAD